MDRGPTTLSRSEPARPDRCRTSSKPISGIDTMPSYEKPASTAPIMVSNIYDVWFAILLVSKDESGENGEDREAGRIQVFIGYAGLGLWWHMWTQGREDGHILSVLRAEPGLTMRSGADPFCGESTRAPQNVHYTRGLEGPNQTLIPPYIRTTFLKHLEALSLGLVGPEMIQASSSAVHGLSLCFRQHHRDAVHSGSF